MPRFFFDFDDGEGLTLDKEGCEHASTAAACDDARRALIETAAERQQSEDRWAVTCRVRSEAGSLVRTIALAMYENLGSNVHAA